MKNVTFDLAASEAECETLRQGVDYWRARAEAAEKEHAEYLQECNVQHNEDNAKLQAAEKDLFATTKSLLAQVRKGLKTIRAAHRMFEACFEALSKHTDDCQCKQCEAAYWTMGNFVKAYERWQEGGAK